MAFFTRHNATVPILPTDQPTTEKKQTDRYEYVVDRELGVEV